MSVLLMYVPTLRGLNQYMEVQRHSSFFLLHLLQLLHFVICTYRGNVHTRSHHLLKKPYQTTIVDHHSKKLHGFFVALPPKTMTSFYDQSRMNVIQSPFLLMYLKPILLFPFYPVAVKWHFYCKLHNTMTSLELSTMYTPPRFWKEILYKIMHELYKRRGIHLHFRPSWCLYWGIYTLT